MLLLYGFSISGQNIQPELYSLKL